ncbi:MAG: hypothetical protein WCB85_14140 [Candidatus Dormiibacterota bacterium]
MNRGALLAGLGALIGLAANSVILADPGPHGGAPLIPGKVLVATSVDQYDPNIVAGVTQLPPGCGTVADPYPCETAVTGGAYPQVFNNDTVDAFFGVTSPITLEELTPSGQVMGTVDVPSGPSGVVTSFSSKSELALNLSTDGREVNFMGYAAEPDETDVSNGSTPGDMDPTDGDFSDHYRVVASLDRGGDFTFTETNAYSGDNGRAAVVNDASDVIYAAGNAGNGANPEPAAVVLGVGAQLIQPSDLPESEQTPGQPTAVGSFNINQLGDALDKSAKDDNFRGMTVSNNVLYYTKGSGGNGIDTVYFVDTTGSACPSGSGLPAPGASLPTSSSFSYVANEGTSTKKPDPGLEPQNMCILNGFPSVLAANASDSSDYPFGIWFADPDTLYVADEGAGDNTYDPTTNSYTAAAASTTAGLQKWVFNHDLGEWQLAYTLQNGLALGQPYSVPGYPTGLNDGPGGSGLPWAPATDGLRNITGQLNPNGTVTIWAETSTVSGGGDQGADPNKLVGVTDRLDATTLPTWERFETVRPAVNATVYRGVAFSPGTSPGPGHMPLPPAPFESDAMVPAPGRP